MGRRPAFLLSAREAQNLSALASFRETSEKKSKISCRARFQTPLERVSDHRFNRKIDGKNMNTQNVSFQSLRLLCSRAKARLVNHILMNTYLIQKKISTWSRNALVTKIARAQVSRISLTIVAVIAAAAAFIGNSSAQPQAFLDAQRQTPRYRVIDLGTVGDLIESSANSINERGQIVGNASQDSAFASAHAAFWAGGCGGPGIELSNGGEAGGTRAFGINPRGQIIGAAGQEAYSSFHAVYWASSSSPRITLTGPGGGLGYQGLAINARGRDFVGSTFNDDLSFFRVLVWANSSSFPGATQRLIRLEQCWIGPEFHCLNDAGQIVGGAFNEAATLDRAVFWANGGSPAVDLGTVAGELTHSFAEAINNKGQIVGEAWNDSFAVFHALYWANSASPAIDLGALGGDLTNSVAEGISNNGQIIGYAYNDDFSVQHAIFWANSNTPAIDLNSAIPTGSGWELQRAGGIGPSGVIVGRGIFAGQSRGFALIPRHGQGD